MEKNNIPEFEKIIRNEKVVLVDPVSKVYLGVSNKIANNLDKQEVKEFLYPCLLYTSPSPRDCS